MCTRFPEPGGFLLNAVLLVVARMNPGPSFTRRDTTILAINAVIYSVTVVAYTGFDTVLVGLGTTARIDAPEEGTVARKGSSAARRVHLLTAGRCRVVPSTTNIAAGRSTRRWMEAVTLAGFLRARRAAVAPGDDDGRADRRRVPGLRREEVARGINVSLDYYSRLEQGRRVRPSDGVLEALTEVLRLDRAAREHLFDLARHAAEPPQRRQPPQGPANPGMLRLMSSLGTHASILLGRRLDILAASPTARLLFGDFAAMPVRERNALRCLLSLDYAREMHLDWEAVVAGLVGMLRLDARRCPDDLATRTLVEEFHTKYELFSHLWRTGQVAGDLVAESKTVEHPLVGRIRLTVEPVTRPGEREQVLHVMIPADRPSELALGRLRRLAKPAAAQSGIDRTAAFVRANSCFRRANGFLPSGPVRPCVMVLPLSAIRSRDRQVLPDFQGCSKMHGEHWV